MANCILLPYREVGVIRVPRSECITNTEILIFEVLMAVITETAVFWDVTPCSLIGNLLTSQKNLSQYKF
jgi:hypothetical protein